jgi:hypothetical protein
MSDKGWHRAFDDPFLPGCGELRTLRDAGDFIAGLPKHEHEHAASVARCDTGVALLPSVTATP